MITDVPSAPSIRAATRADLTQIGSLAALLVQAHHEYDPARFLPATGATPHHYARFLGSQLDEADAVFLVAHSGDRIIGYAYGALEGYDYMALRGPAGVIHDLVVDPAHRGRAVGQRLLDATLEQLTSRGAPRVVLFTAENNHAAQRLFARSGFRPTMIEMTRESDGQVQS
jgi:ribosomal protein S18 acetylase RimI-like enzyme